MLSLLLSFFCLLSTKDVPALLRKLDCTLLLDADRFPIIEYNKVVF